MKIEIGKYYKMENGNAALVVAERPHEFKWIGYRLGDATLLTWNDDGDNNITSTHNITDDASLDWSKELAWVRYIAMDQCGRWFRFENEPYCDDGLWATKGFYQPMHPTEAPVCLTTWDKSLTKRP